MHQVYDSDRLRVKYQIPKLLSFKNQQPQWKKGFLGSLSRLPENKQEKYYTDLKEYMYLIRDRIERAESTKQSGKEGQ